MKKTTIFFLFLPFFFIQFMNKSLAQQNSTPDNSVVFSVGPDGPAGFSIAKGTIVSISGLDFLSSCNINMTGVLNISKRTVPVNPIPFPSASLFYYIDNGNIFFPSPDNSFIGSCEDQWGLTVNDNDFNDIIGLASGKYKFVYHDGVSWKTDNNSNYDAGNKTITSKVPRSNRITEIGFVNCEPVTNSFSASGCNSYTLPWGLTVTSSGVYSKTFTSFTGCDSTVNITVTINTSTTGTQNIFTCNAPYLWNGQSYSTSGTYTFNTTNAAGCDSTAVLVLKVGAPSSSTTNLLICNTALPFNWNGRSINAAGTYTATLTNASGCDSTAVLNLEVSTAIPAAPSSVTQTLVVNDCGARIYRYSVGAVANASGYAWTIPTSLGGVAGVSVDSGDINRSSVIRLKYVSNNANNKTGDSIKVRAYSGCGTSAVKAFKLTSKAWTPLGTPSITATNVVTNVCNGRKVRYSTAVPATTSGAVGFEWTFVGTGLGANAKIDSGNATSRIIVVLYTSNAASNNTDSVRLRYVYNNGCSYSSYVRRSLGISALAQPAAPTAVTATIVTGTSSTCNSRKVRYSVPVPPASSTTPEVIGYSWSFVGSVLHGGLGTTYVIDSAASNGSGGFDLSASRVIVVRYISNVAAGTDSARCAYVTACGSSPRRAVRVPLTGSLTNCPAPTSNIALNRAEASSAIDAAETGFGVSVYPNPSMGKFNLQLNNIGNEEVIIRVLDLQGRFIRLVRSKANRTLSLGQDLMPGSYLLEIRQGTKVKTIRVSKL